MVYFNLRIDWNKIVFIVPSKKKEEEEEKEKEDERNNVLIELRVKFGDMGFNYLIWLGLRNALKNEVDAAL